MELLFFIAIMNQLEKSESVLVFFFTTVINILTVTLLSGHQSYNEESL